MGVLRGKTLAGLAPSALIRSGKLHVFFLVFPIFLSSCFELGNQPKNIQNASAPEEGEASDFGVGQILKANQIAAITGMQPSGTILLQAQMNFEPSKVDFVLTPSDSQVRINQSVVRFTTMQMTSGERIWVAKLSVNLNSYPAGLCKLKVTSYTPDGKASDTKLISWNIHQPDSTFTQTQLAMNVLRTQCIGCHSGSYSPNLGSLISLDDATNNNAWVASGLILPGPGNATRSILFNSLQAQGGQMPKSATALSTLENQAIATWIESLPATPTPTPCSRTSS